VTALRTYRGFARGLAAVFAAVLLLRSLVPAGYMIDPAAARNGELAIILCEATAASSGKHHADPNDPHAGHHGMHGDTDSDSKYPHQGESLSCGLAAATLAFLTPDAIPVAVPQDFAAATPETPVTRQLVGAIARPAQARAPPLA